MKTLSSNSAQLTFTEPFWLQILRSMKKHRQHLPHPRYIEVVIENIARNYKMEYVVTFFHDGELRFHDAEQFYKCVTDQPYKTGGVA